MPKVDLVRPLEIAMRVESHYHANLYELRPNGRLPWLQRRLFAVLRRLGCAGVYVPGHAFRTKVINRKTLTDAILKQQESVDDFLKKRPRVVYMGANEFEKLFGEWGEPRPFTGQFGHAFEYGVGRNGRTTYRIASMEIRVIPWMKGFLVVGEAGDAQG